MDEIIKGLLDIEHKAQDIAHEATDLELNLEQIIIEKKNNIKKTIEQENKLILENRLNKEEKRLKTQIKELRVKNEKKVSEIQARYVLNKQEIEDKIFNRIIGR